MQFRINRLASIAFLATIAGCGDDHSSSPSSSPNPGGNAADAPTPAGLWFGSTDTNRTVTGVVLPDKTYWFAYDEAVGGDLAGVLHGTLSIDGNHFSTLPGQDVNFEGLGVLEFQADGNFADQQSLDGTINYENGMAVHFSTRFDTDFLASPDLNLLAGSYGGRATTNGSGGAPAQLEIAADGAITGTSGSLGGCKYAGTATPRSNRYAFNVSITFQGGPCAHGTETLTGVALHDRNEYLLKIIALNATGTDGFLFDGFEPHGE